MLNVLNEAMPHIQGLIAQQSIKIVTKKRIIDKGIPKTEISEIETFAQIQALTPFEIAKISDNAFSGANVYKFYIVGDLAKVINFLDNADSLIIWQGIEYEVYSKSDYSLNGWIQVIASAKKAVENV